jgi:predicted transposase YbfD/YdcC
MEGLRCFAVLESERGIGDKTSCERRLHISSLAPDAPRISPAFRSYGVAENRLHWSMDVSFNDGQMRARTKAAAQNLAVLKHITLHLIRLNPIRRKGGVKARRLITATSDSYRAELLGLRECSFDCPGGYESSERTTHPKARNISKDRTPKPKACRGLGGESSRFLRQFPKCRKLQPPEWQIFSRR